MQTVERLARKQIVLAAIVGVFCVLIAWVLTRPQALIALNWDNANYVATFAMKLAGWDMLPWNSHYGIGHVYWLGSQLARLFGGSYVDGIRLTNALAMGLTAFWLMQLMLELGLSRRASTLWTFLWMLSWGNLYLIQVLEDQMLYMPTAIGLMRLAIVRSGQPWRTRDLVLAGALGAFGVMMSVQAIIYLVAPGVALVFFAHETPLPRRIRNVATMVGAMAMFIFAWVLVVWATSPQKLVDLLRILFSRPTASYFPHTGKEWVALLIDMPALARSMGVGVIHELDPMLFVMQPHGGAPPVSPTLSLIVGSLALGIQIALVVIAARRYRRDHSDVIPAIASATLLLLSIATSYYRDLEIDKIKRYDFLPLAAVVVAAVFMARAEKLRDSRLAWPPFVVAALAIVSLLGTLYRNQLFLAAIPIDSGKWIHSDHPQGAYWGRNQLSWFGYYTSVRQAKPDACAYLFAYDELKEGSWDVPAIAPLWAELPTHRVITTAPVEGRWKFRPQFATIAEVEALRSCAWLSPTAAALLATPSPSPSP